MHDTTMHEVRGRLRGPTLAGLRRIQARLDLSESQAVRAAVDFYVRHTAEVYQRVLTEDHAEQR